MQIVTSVLDDTGNTLCPLLVNMKFMTLLEAQ